MFLARNVHRGAMRIPFIMETWSSIAVKEAPSVLSERGPFSDSTVLCCKVWMPALLPPFPWPCHPSPADSQHSQQGTEGACRRHRSDVSNLMTDTRTKRGSHLWSWGSPLTRKDEADNSFFTSPDYHSLLTNNMMIPLCFGSSY